MRIGTWNLERATGRDKNRHRLDLIASMQADLWVLTETHDDIDLSRLGHRTRPFACTSVRATRRAMGHDLVSLPVVGSLDLDDPVRTTAAVN